MSSNRFHSLFIGLLVVFSISTLAESIPLPEHPRPDFMREGWINLNGEWDFKFDKDNSGIKQAWFKDTEDFDQTITVPFPWGSKLSGVKDEADIGWYAKTINIPQSWQDQRIFLIIGASDWHTTVWLDGKKIGEFQGGYIPFEFELTDHIEWGNDQKLVVRADDERRMFTLYGKQGYGNARGIWQTPYLEARGKECFKSIHFYPDIDEETVTAKVKLLEAAKNDLQVEFKFKNGGLDNPVHTQRIPKGSKDHAITIPIPNPTLWSLDDPFLYELTVSLEGNTGSSDQVHTYFGMRKISVVNLPGTDIPYVALNDKPVYLQMALDQAYHPEGFYTFPSDEFTRDEILRSKQIGLNGMRVHVKVPLPRKLYWADKLGMLIMEDIPNSWGEPNEAMREEIERTIPAVIERDFNHPATFSWCLFNETWGLFTGKGNKRAYLPETQKWVQDMYTLAKELDPTRLVEDNSPCNYDHVETDLNTWHSYLPGWAWKDFLDNACAKTYPGSEWNFAEGYTQDNDPMFNSECGNVWGYQGSTGDIDWSWDYHRMINQFRRHPKCAGWLYTEHHDVINEWNGYWKYDRSEKFTGMDELVDGMSLEDLHAPVYLVVGDEMLCQPANPGDQLEIPLFLSIFTDQLPGSELTIRWQLSGWDRLGNHKNYQQSSTSVSVEPWMNEALEPLSITLPDESGLFILKAFVEDSSGSILQRNFMLFDVDGESDTDALKDASLVRFDAANFTNADWSLKQWNVLDGLKVNGAGSGYFEYEVSLPEGIDENRLEGAVLRFEASAKQLFGKDKEQGETSNSNYMLGGGAHDPSENKNAYPMTDTYKAPSQVKVEIDGHLIGSYLLEDDPADHRGILSWASQKKDRLLREAGSYGYLINAIIPPDILNDVVKDGRVVIRLSVDESLPGGLAIYGKRFGRYPLDPTLILHK